MKKKITYLILSLILTGISITELKSRDFGFYSSYNINRHEADIRQIRLSPDTIPAILSGANSGFSAGLFYDFKLSRRTTLRTLISYTSNNAELSKNTKSFVPINGIDTIAVVSNLMNVRLSSLEFNPELRINLIGNLFFIGGLSVGYRLSDSYNIHQAILSQNIFYQDGSSKRVLNFKDQNSYLQSALNIGIAYRVNLDRYQKYSIMPELDLTYGFSKLYSGFNVDVTSIKFGISIACNPKVKFPEQKIPIVIETAPPAIVQQKVPLKDTVSEAKSIEIKKASVDTSTKINLIVNIVRNGIERQSDILHFKYTISSNILPVLNYIFFDKNSSEISERYKLLDSSEVMHFTESKIHNLSTLDKYHQTLNIIGRRMKNYPKAIITLTGCNSGDDESNSHSLSGKRSSSIKDYLIKQWNIEAKRIICESRNLPSNFSGLKDSLSLEENRRVEITTDKSEILDFLSTNDTMLTSNETIRLRIANGKEIKDSWELLISNNNKIIKIISGSGEIPEIIDWKPTQNELKNLNEAYPIVFTILNPDSSDYWTIPEEKLGFDIEKTVKSNLTLVDDNQIENYSLILFDFNRGELTKRHFEIIDYLSTKLNPDSKIIIEGHTDITGDSTYNVKLSSERAINAYKALIQRNKDAECTYVGKGYTSIYDNKLPEGRFYSRTVIIRVISKKK